MTREHEPLEATLQRLADERAAADRLYHDALTALDKTVFAGPELPHTPAAYDEQQLAPLNTVWDIGLTAPARTGLKGRLAAFVWSVVGPMLQKQLTFNSTIVDHINRNAAAHREGRQAIEAMLAATRAETAYLRSLHSHLILYVQQITAYVDTKDRETAGRALVVNAAVNALAEDLAKRWESMTAREQRFDARVSALTAAHDELRTLVGVVQQATLTLKRELERAALAPPASVQPPTSNLQPPTSNLQSPTSNLRPPASNLQPPASNLQPPAAFAPALDSYKYVGFEDQFRGSQETIRERLASYLPYFEGAKDVLDVGCGRGEFLDLLTARGITARGLDLNHEMVEVCRARGLDVTEQDAVGYLETLPDASLGGLFAAQVVEHLQPAYLLRFLELACHKLKPGAPIVLETLNPACWTAFFDSFIRDITHVWPLHPDTLRYLVLASGFSSARIEYRSPVAPHDKLQPAAAGAGLDADLVEAFNANVEKLNARMFTFLDYAIAGRR
jgi:SAM-dependent methyltransferase